MHLVSSSLKESSAAYRHSSLAITLLYLCHRLLNLPAAVDGEQSRLTAVKQCVSGEDDLIVAILHKPADAVLGMARRVMSLYSDAANAP